VRGLVRIRSFTDDPAAFADYGPLADEAGRRRFAVTVKSTVKGQFLAAIDGIADRDAAQALAGTTLWVDRDRLPEPEEEDAYYHADLLGLAVETADGTPLGTVRAIHDFGAGDVVEIARPGMAPVVVPFTRAVVPVVDIAGGRVVVDPPAGLLDPPEREAAEPDTGTDGAKA
jgi:16S rRNA processing protein RimM